VKKVLLFSAIVVLLVVSMAIPLACGKTQEGQLPTFEKGNTWTHELVSGGVYYTGTSEVTGEATVNGQDCWVREVSYVPPLSGIESSSARFDKTNWFEVQGQETGTYGGIGFTRSETISYQFLDGSLWPLEVGKEVRVVETTTTTTVFAGETETETETLTVTRKVEAIEEITVPAGKFKCFKVGRYDESGSELATYWYSDKVKNHVKYVDIENDVTFELKSYSV
jgi:hypothetical protein